MKNLQQFDNRDFLSIETFRKTGVGVKSPIWFVELDGEFLMWTDVSSGKIKRIRNNPQVMVAPCKRFGDITAERAAHDLHLRPGARRGPEQARPL